MAVGEKRPTEVRVTIHEMEDRMAMDDRNPAEVSVETAGPEELAFIYVERFAWAKKQVERDNYLSDTDKAKSSFIQRVSPHIRELDSELKKNFEPRVVAIGPFHRGNHKLEGAEETKLLFACLFSDTNGKSGDVLRRGILEKIKDLRECYSSEDIVGYSDEDLSWMLFVDGCAVLYAISVQGSPDAKYRERLTPSVYVDLLLLENQLPYRLLEILIDSTSNPPQWYMWIDSFVYAMAATVLGGSLRSAGVVSGRRDEAARPLHLLQIFHTQLLQGERERGKSSIIGRILVWLGEMAGDKKTAPGAKNLVASGISFKSNECEYNNLRNISFHSKFPAILKMPILQVDDCTAYLFMNLIALESCPSFRIPGYSTTVRSYLGFTAYLIQTPEDVKELRTMGMLRSYLKNDDQVYVLFRAMGTPLDADLEIQHFVIDQIERYCNSWFAKYFSSHWSILTFTGALTGIVMSVVQTLFTVYKYLKADTKSD